MITDVLTGWLGLVVVLLAAGCALAADHLRQGVDPVGGSARSRPRRVRWLTAAAVVLAGLGAVAIVLRFVTLA